MNDVLYLMPFNPHNPRKISALSLDLSDVSDFIRAIDSMMVGDLPWALLCFKTLLLFAHTQGPLWHSAVLLWCAMLSLYNCDPTSAPDYVSKAEEISPSGETPEIMLVKGMTKRMARDFSGASSALQFLAKPRLVVPPGMSNMEALEWVKKIPPEEFPVFDLNDLAMAWKMESEAAAGKLDFSEQEIEYLERTDLDIYQGCIGIFPAAVYRLLKTTGLSPKGVRSPDELLAAMDELHIAQRPMITMLLQDILPRPLKGVIEARNGEETAVYPTEVH
ncbi:MAG: hypothetical protein ABFD64_10290 [Armatimonadota bacterium]